MFIAWAKCVLVKSWCPGDQCSAGTDCVTGAVSCRGEMLTVGNIAVELVGCS